VYDVMARMESHDWDRLCLQMLHGKSMARFLVLNNMAYDVMANEELMVFSTNSPFTILYFVYGEMHVCNYSQISYTVVYDTSRIHSVM
jgi:hypothetical protein